MHKASGPTLGASWGGASDRKGNFSHAPFSTARLGMAWHDRCKQNPWKSTAQVGRVGIHPELVRAPMTKAQWHVGQVFRNELTDDVLLEQEAGSSVPANPCAQKHPKRHHYPGSLTASDTHWTAGRGGGRFTCTKMGGGVTCHPSLLRKGTRSTEYAHGTM